jgi:hypothetical protein
MAGQFETPVLTLSFFNPDTEKYNILRTPAHTLLGGHGGSGRGNNLISVVSG